MEKKEYFRPSNPFNPGSAADPQYFVGRALELENFRQRLMQTADGSIACMSVAGGYGAGKTSFLHKCSSIAEAEGALTIYFSLNEISNINREGVARVLIERLRDKVAQEVILQKLAKSVLETLNRIKVSARVGRGAEISVGLENTKELFTPTLHAALICAWEALKGKKKAIVFLIDEAAVLEKNKEELLLYLRAVLEQLQLSRTPVMIVPAGKFSVSRGPLGAGFSPLVRTFPQAILANFNESESTQFITKKLSSAGMSISDIACRKAHDASEGHPYVLNAYLNEAYSKLLPGEMHIEERHLRAVDVYFATETLRHFFQRFYEGSGKMGRAILSKMAVKSEITLPELMAVLKKKSNELSPFLAKLVQDGSIHRIDRGRYRLFHHLFASYLKEAARQA